MKKGTLLKKIKDWIIILAQTAVITGITVFSVAPLSCKVTTSGLEIIGGDYSAPVLQNINVIDEKTVELDFSEPVEIISFVVSPVISEISDSEEHSDTEELSLALKAATGKFGNIECQVNISENKQIITFNFSDETETGKQYEILGVVKDRIGNSLTFSVPFTGYNNRVPKIIMTEIHTSMISQTKKEKELNIRRLEYIEFIALSDGNLVGLELCSGVYGESAKYSFPPVDVKAGERFVLHLRNWGDGCISEEGNDLTLSKSQYTDDSVRDLWLSQTGRFLGDKTDIIVLRNNLTDKVIDAVMYRDENIADWNEKITEDFSKEDGFLDVYDCGGSIENATIATKLSPSMVLQRKNIVEIQKAVENKTEIKYPIQVDADSWIICKPSLPLKQ